jgi:DNA-binding NarL/FixJ family response regulator
MDADRGEEAVEWARQARLLDPDRLPGWLARQAWEALPGALVYSGHLDGAQDLCEEVLTQARAAGDLNEQADVLFLMAMLARKSGHLADCGVYLREAAEVALHGGYLLRLIDLVDEGGFLCAATGRQAEAITLWSATAAQNEAAGLADTLEAERRRKPLMKEAARMLGQQLYSAAEERGVGMTLAAAVEFTVMMTDENIPAPTAPSTSGKLSARERELVAMVAQGQTDTQIAERLFISVSTVRTHLDRIRDKSGYRRRADLTRLALQEGII